MIKSSNLLSFLIDFIVSNDPICYLHLIITGKIDEALRIYTDVEKLQLEVLGERHVEYLRTKNNLALCLRDKGNCIFIYVKCIGI